MKVLTGGSLGRRCREEGRSGRVPLGPPPMTTDFHWPKETSDEADICGGGEVGALDANLRKGSAR